jgi:hypothetical protein
MDKRIEELKKRISRIDWIFVGTLLKRYKSCGKEKCPCGKDQKFWHGPYYIWTRKERGKTVTQTLNEEQAELVKKGLKNRKGLNKELEYWKKLSIEELKKRKLKKE